MKRSAWLLILMAGILTVPAFSQDVIYRTDGSREEARITLVGEKEIHYKKLINPDGPEYSLSKSEILLIEYENGSYEAMGEKSSPENGKNLDIDFARNVISYHLFDLVFMDFTVSYERIFPSGKMGIRIPVAFGYDYYNDLYEFSNIVYSGIGVNFYPTGQGKWRYFMGPQVRFGLGRESDWLYYYDEEGLYQYDEYVENEGFYTKFFIDNGVMFMPVKNFSVSAIGSIGIRYFPEAVYNEDVVRTTGHFAINLGYRF